MAKYGSTGAEVRAIQHALGLVIDGYFGAKTKAAAVDFQRINRLKPDGIVGPHTWSLLKIELGAKELLPLDRSAFFNEVRGLFRGGLKQSQVDGLNALLDAVTGCGINEAAYMLATACHETDFTMLPIEERGKGRGRDYGKRLKESRQPYNDTAAIFYGRGYVQLTWYENYAKAGKKLGINLLQEPELALRPLIAARIMREGMIEGWFTGRKLSDYVGLYRAEYVGARRIINGQDKAAAIAGYAIAFETALRKAKK